MGSSRAPDGVAGGGRKRLCRAQAEGVRAVRCTAVFGRVLLFFLSVPVPSVCRCPGIAGNRVRDKDPFLPTPIGLHGGNRVLIVVGGLWCYRVYRWKEVRETASSAWHRKQMFYRSGAYEQAAEVYAEIYEDMKWNARYLFEYGHALHKLHRNEESNVVMKEALKVSGDPMILNIIGKNEQEAGNYAEAEYWLIRSTHRLPGRIYPYFLLAKLYAEPGFYQRQKLEQAARMVMEKEPKVQSTAIRQMREEIKKLL